MKKRLEADLVSIAHRILQLKNKSDVNQLFLETKNYMKNYLFYDSLMSIMALPSLHNPCK
jgi:hypothetical protein